MTDRLNKREDEPLLFPELEEFFRPEIKTTPEEIKMNEENYKTISEVAVELDIAASVIRYWETKFKPLSPIKRNGRRYFSLEQQKLIEQIKGLLYVQGYTIKAAQDIVLHNEKNIQQNSAGIDNQKPNKELINSIIERLNSIKGALK